MWPDRVSNPGPLTYESGALPIALECRKLSVLPYRKREILENLVKELKKNKYESFILLNAPLPRTWSILK